MSKTIKGKLTDIYSYQFKNSEELRIIIKAIRDDESLITLDLSPLHRELGITQKAAWHLIAHP